VISCNGLSILLLSMRYTHRVIGTCPKNDKDLRNDEVRNLKKQYQLTFSNVTNRIDCSFRCDRRFDSLVGRSNLAKYNGRDTEFDLAEQWRVQKIFSGGTTMDRVKLVKLPLLSKNY
jgi:hypothetical protein